MSIKSAFLIALAALALSSGAQAAERPSAEEIVRQLTPNVPSGEPGGGPVPRGLRARGIAVEGGQPVVDAPPSIDLEVNFEYNSAKLTADARLVLDNLGKALNDPALAKSRFLVAGHTDGKGSDEYNMALSQSRARAVADYLSRIHGVSLSRLQVAGYGRSRLRDPEHPESAINRRVQVANLGGG